MKQTKTKKIKDEEVIAELLTVAVKAIAEAMLVNTYGQNWKNVPPSKWKKVK